MLSSPRFRLSALLAAALLLFCSVLTGCRSEAPTAGVPAPVTPPAVSPSPDLSAASDAASSPAASPAPEAEALTFRALRRYDFIFASGAGAWSTSLEFREDGSFSGLYQDADAGILYCCAFSGQFAPLEPVSEYVWRTRVESIRYENEPGTEEYLDGVRRVYSEPYGLAGAEDVLIFLPGAPRSALPQGFLDWVDCPDSSLSSYGLYNEAEQYGFSGWDLVESLQSSLTAAEETAQLLNDAVDSGALSQIELNRNARNLYENWDYVLNCQWAALKRLMEPDAMETLTAQQRAWIVQKEANVKAAGADVEGGTLYPAVTQSAAAEITRQRVYELQEILTRLD